MPRPNLPPQPTRWIGTRSYQTGKGTPEGVWVFTFTTGSSFNTLASVCMRACESECVCVCARARVHMCVYIQREELSDQLSWVWGGPLRS